MTLGHIRHQWLFTFSVVVKVIYKETAIEKLKSKKYFIYKMYLLLYKLYLIIYRRKYYFL